MRFDRAVVWLSMVTFGGFGAAFTVAPSAMAAIVDIELPTGTALAEFRATYGGFELGIAAFLAWCVRDDRRLRAGLMVTALSLAGFAAARLLSVALDGPVRSVTYLLLAAELGGATIAFIALRRVGPRAAGGAAPPSTPAG